MFSVGVKKSLKGFLIPLLALVISIVLVSGDGLYRLDADYPVDSTGLMDRTYADVYSDDVASSSLLQRINILKSSLAVIWDRPNIDGTATRSNLSAHLFGYGPESFRIAFMHRSGLLTDSKIPISTNHSHNVLLHSWIETGILGVSTIFGLVLTVIIGSIYQLVRFRHSLTTFQLVFLIIQMD